MEHMKPSPAAPERSSVVLSVQERDTSTAVISVGSNYCTESTSMLSYSILNNSSSEYSSAGNLLVACAAGK